MSATHEDRPASPGGVKSARDAVPANTRRRSPRPSVFLHIGMHKTGTTAVQVFATANRGELRNRGICYPNSGCPGDQTRYGHHLLAWSLRQASDPENVWGPLRDEIASFEGTSIVLSSEDFCHISAPAKIDWIRRFLDGYDIKVVAYLRRQDQYIQALYSTDVLHYGQRASMETYIAYNAPRLDYRNVLAPWTDTLTSSSIRVRPYERGQMVRGDVIDDFFEVVGLSQLGGLARPAQGTNRSYPLPALGSVVRLGNMGMDAQEMDLFLRVIKLVYSDLESKSDLLSPSECHALIDRFRASNHEIARRYLGREDGRLFDEVVQGDDPSWRERYGSRDAALRVLLQDLRGALSDGTSRSG